MFVTLQKLAPLSNYDPQGRRDVSANGGFEDKIPLPLWISNKPDASKSDTHARKIVTPHPSLSLDLTFVPSRTYLIQEHHPRMSLPE